MYADLDHGLREGRQTILLGQTSDRFKARLGCRAERRYIYVRPMLPAYRGLMKVGFRHLFPDREAPPTHDIYRTCEAKPAFDARLVRTDQKKWMPVATKYSIRDLIVPFRPFCLPMPQTSPKPFSDSRFQCFSERPG
jgi:hypothetical protein